MQLAGGPSTRSQWWNRSCKVAQSANAQIPASPESFDGDGASSWGHRAVAVRDLPTACAFAIQDSGRSGITTTVEWPAAWRALMNGAKYGDEADGGPSSFTTYPEQSVSEPISPSVSHEAELRMRLSPSNRGRPRNSPRSEGGPSRGKWCGIRSPGSWGGHGGGWFAHQELHIGCRKSPNSLLEHCPKRRSVRVRLCRDELSSCGPFATGSRGSRMPGYFRLKVV